MLVSAAAEPLDQIKKQVEEGLKELQKPEEEDTHPELPVTGKAPRQTLPRGIEITGVSVGGLQLPEDVTAKRIASWQVGWMNRIAHEVVTGELEAQKLFQQAQARAQIESIDQLLTSIESMRQQSGIELYEAVMLRLMEMAETMWANRTVRRLDHHGELIQLSAEAAGELRRALGRDDE